tara:strand:- start:2514 stop:2990 length:477 start_codon:yes stop_codon:yes gene_type:complete
MAQLNETFSVDALPVSERNFEPLPAGWYTTVVAGAEIKNTKAGTGQYISIRYDVTGPTHQGRVVFGNLNIKNPNPKAEEIGRQQLGELMRAIGLSTVQDTDQLIGGQLMIKLDVRESEQYGASNDVKGFKSNGSAPPAGAKAAPAAASGKAAPPWVKK